VLQLQRRQWSERAAGACCVHPGCPRVRRSAAGMRGREAGSAWGVLRPSAARAHGHPGARGLGVVAVHIFGPPREKCCSCSTQQKST